MNKKIRFFGICLLVLVWAGLAAALWFGPKADYTYSERRKLAQMPSLSANTILNGKFMPDFEDFTLDQFPLRDGFRKVKSLFHYYVLNQADNNGLYLVGDTVAKIEYPLNRSSLGYATGRLQNLYDTYLADTGCKVYSAVVPDKGYYLAENNGYPAMDYDALFDAFQEKLSWAEYVPIQDLLTAKDYYRTDTHWRQEMIVEVARRLCETMGAKAPVAGEYTRKRLEQPFYGVYFGQAALPLQPDTLAILEHPVLKNCTVTDPVTGKQTEVYNLEKLSSPDLYDVFLSGAQPVLVIDNPSADTERELVLFRDSFGSSLSPLLVEGYRKVTLVDIRYIAQEQIGQYVTFADQDVLFLYSTLILNSGRSLK